MVVPGGAARPFNTVGAGLGSGIVPRGYSLRPPGSHAQVPERNATFQPLCPGPLAGIRRDAMAYHVNRMARMKLPILLGASHLGGSGASRRRRASRVARLLLVLALSAGSLAAAPAPAQAATTATIYRPNHRVHFDAGTYTGYKFSASGTILAHKTATLSRASGAATSLRTTVPGHIGNWLAIVNGIWAGYSIHESNRTYLPFARLRLVAFAAGAHTGYKFNAAGAVVAHKTFTLTRASGASASTQAFIVTKTYLLIVNGIWAGYWVPVGSGVGLKYPPLGSNRLGLRRVVGGLDQPLFVTNADDGTNRLFIVQRTGLVRVFRAGLLQSAAFLNLTGKISCCDGERGLLGLAFHPGFVTNRRLFAYYTDSTGDIIAAEYTANAAGTSASATTERVLLRINHRTYSNHDGGWIGFGPDGYLYIATGDGGGGGDPLGNGQNRYALLGKILRINVNGAPPTPFHPRIRSRTGAAPRRYGRTGCGTHGATASTASPAACSLGTWARAPSRRSIGQPSASAGRTTAGT